MTVPESWPVQPLKPGESAKDRMRCGTCGREWDDGIVTSMTPTPAARCPFESFHDDDDGDDETATVEVRFSDGTIARWGNVNAADAERIESVIGMADTVLDDDGNWMTTGMGTTGRGKHDDDEL